MKFIFNYIASAHLAEFMIITYDLAFQLLLGFFRAGPVFYAKLDFSIQYRVSHFDKIVVVNGFLTWQWIEGWYLRTDCLALRVAVEMLSKDIYIFIYIYIYT